MKQLLILLSVLFSGMLIAQKNVYDYRPQMAATIQTLKILEAEVSDSTLKLVEERLFDLSVVTNDMCFNSLIVFEDTNVPHAAGCNCESISVVDWIVNALSGLKGKQVELVVVDIDQLMDDFVNVIFELRYELKDPVLLDVCSYNWDTIDMCITPAGIKNVMYARRFYE